MRKLTSLTLAVVVFAAGLVLTTTKAHAQAPNIKGVETKNGVEVAAKVRGLRRDNQNIEAALRQFESRGHRPKVEEATSISGAIERGEKEARNDRGFAITKASFAQTFETAASN